MIAAPRLTCSPPVLLLFIIAASFPCVQALRFYLHDRERRCFKFDAPFSSRVIGERSVANGRGTAELSVEIKSSDGKIVYESHVADPADSKFSFNTPDFTTGIMDHDDFDDYDYGDYEGDGTYHVCLMLTFDAAVHKSGKRAVTFWIRPDAPQQGNPSRRHATEDAVGTVTRSLQAMHNVLQNMISDLTALQQRERRLVRRSKATAQRLTLFAVVALVVMIATAASQMVFFKSFFKAKKLL